MQQLAEVADDNINKSKRWTIDQESILFGIYYCKFMSSGRLYKPTKTQFLLSINNLFHAFQDELLNSNERCKRTTKAIESRYKNIKDKNRENNRLYLSKLKKHFFAFKTMKFMKTKLFKEESWCLSTKDIINQIKTVSEVKWKNLKIPIGYENERSNAWKQIENVLLVGAVSKKFVITGSFCPFRGSNKTAWEETYEYFEELKLKISLKYKPNIKFHVRESTSLERHFKEFRISGQQYKICAFYFYFVKLQNDGVL